MQVSLALLVLPGVIDELELGWDFLSAMETILNCAGIKVRIPDRRRSKGQEEWHKDAKFVGVVGFRQRLTMANLNT
ncbi:hypothetical protein ACLKA6_002320 [Drosophila palustris]